MAWISVARTSARASPRSCESSHQTWTSHNAIRAARAEAALAGAVSDEDALKAAAALAAEAAEPVSDLRGPAEYKRDMVRVLAQRALNRALDRAMRATS